ncbi:MAG: hypothetical protein LQ350_004131 [Teloschistes chrysophthalmus]|nr:MAG: hypothetical protein LQ350_004131 [Niorma chrysophthalma]
MDLVSAHHPVLKTQIKCFNATTRSWQFNISTDYETLWPTGITRKYTLVADEMNLNADGVLNLDGKVFNKQYPGPWIQITVKNNLKYNGTTVHWHGIRQLHSLEMDGVPGVSQCPIAPGDSYTYRFLATQYGTSWYHSHYSLQYGDGLAGPLTIHGPSSANYDGSKDPMLMTDWIHRSWFKEFQTELNGAAPNASSILLNGEGSYAGGARQGFKYNTTVERGKRYLMRLINTSISTTFVFAIDNHNITVMSSDFVPIQPYVTDHVVVGIGQRYHIVVEASPEKPDGSAHEGDAFWMRTIPASGCSNFPIGGIPDERQGILYYKNGSTEYPETNRGGFSTACTDEPYDKLVPVVPWQVPQPPTLDLDRNQDLFEVGLDAPGPGQGHPLPNDQFRRWAIGPRPLYLNFSDPTILNLQNTNYKADYVVIPQDVPEGGWIYMIIYGNATGTGAPVGSRLLASVAHPLHLHGHDFTILSQTATPFNGTIPPLKFSNPPRRDVVLLPADGAIAIAFKADNPGSWLFHCHIATHASSGLAMQILERRGAADKLYTPARLGEVDKGCANWDKWFSDPKNLWSQNATTFQDDSGI